MCRKNQNIEDFKNYISCSLVIPLYYFKSNYRLFLYEFLIYAIMDISNSISHSLFLVTIFIDFKPMKCFQVILSKFACNHDRFNQIFFKDDELLRINN